MNDSRLSNFDPPRSSSPIELTSFVNSDAENSDEENDETIVAGASNKVKADSAGRVFVPASFWKETSVEILNKLPYDLNDNKIYQLPAGALLDDQWRWSRYKTGSMKQLIIDERSIGSKKCYYQHCLGSHFCPNMECSYKKEFSKPNTTSPTRGNLCRFCDQPVVFKNCTARRYVARRESYTIVAHYGAHECDPTKKKPQKRLSTSDHDYFTKRFQEDPQLKPSQAASNFLSSILQNEGFEAATSRAENLELTYLSRLKSASKDTTFSQIEELKTNLGEERLA